MAAKDHLTVSIEELRARFVVRQQDGCLLSTGMTRNNAGKEVGGRNYQGYRVVNVGGRPLMAHRVVWALTYGEWPKHQIDHINGDKTDNRICNLRDVPPKANAENRRIKNKHGLQGVRNRNGKWMTQIVINGKPTYLGTFPSAMDAHLAYMAAKRRVHPGCAF